MDVENIPYYNFSEFPVNNDRLLEIVNSSAKRNFKGIIINFGNTFPWSFNGSLIQDFSYSEKIIDKIVTICRHHEINIFPVLSILKDSDSIISSKRYQYLTTDLNGRNVLNPSAAGAAKFIEELMEDLFSLFIYSDHILFELPDYEDAFVPGNDLSLLIERIELFAAAESKHLIFSESAVCLRKGNIYKSQENFRPLYRGKSFNVDVKDEVIKVRNNSYRAISLKSIHNFTGFLDPGNFADDYIISRLESKIETRDLDIIDDFFSNLDNVWFLIRECREILTLIYSVSNYITRIKFIKSVNKLLGEYSDMVKKSKLLINKYKKEYQQGVIEEWISSRVNSVTIQTNDLEIIAEQISGNL
ncbi:MAG: hypothetical protein L3J12_00475 [Spirochaetales bacterium]|nr:hypothetical protein [Spirochaetales bacterium]